MKITVRFTLSLVLLLSCAGVAHAGSPSTPAPSTSPSPSPASAAKEIPITTKSKEALAAFLAARELAETSHATEAEEGFKKAVALDPNFALAHAWLAGYLPSKDAPAMAQKAMTLAKDLSEAERLSVEMRVAFILGDPTRGDAASKRLGELMPDDWRVQMLLAGRAMNGTPRNIDKAITHMKRAAELNPKSGDAWNSLGYAYLEKEKLDDSIAAFKKYAEVVPNDPNAHDSLGDAYLRAGKNAEAEASFQRAIAADAKFTLAWSGVAMARANRGDWNGALAAMKSYVEKTPRALDKPNAIVELAWWQFAAGQVADAEKSFAEAEKLSAEMKLDNMIAIVALHRAAMANESGKHKDALKIVTEATARAAKGTMSEGSRLNVRLGGLQQTLSAHVGLGAKAEAEKAAADLEREVKKLPEDEGRVSWLHEIRGDTARAGADLKTAIAAYQQCWQFAASCLGHGVLAAEKAGDKAAADAMRLKLKNTPARDAAFIVARSQAKLFPASTASAKK